MNEITLTVNNEVMQWLNNRAVAERCTIEDFASLILMAVAVNNLKHLHNETKVQQEA